MGITWKTVYTDPEERFRMQVMEYEPPPPPPPPPPGDRYDYLTLIRAKVLQYHLGHRLQANMHQGVRDLLYVADNCPEVCLPWLVMTRDQVIDLALVGEGLQAQGITLYPSLLNEHRKYSGRSTVRKAKWKAFNQELGEHEQKVEMLRHKAQRHPIRATCAYDSLKGWCQCLNR